MKISAMKEVKDYDRLSDAWNGLTRAPGSSLFVSYEWFRYNLDNLRGLEPFILTAEELGRVKAIAPLCETGSHLKIAFLRFPVTAIRFMENPFSTYCDILTGTESPQDAVKLFIEEIFRKTGWDVTVLSRIPEDSCTVALLRAELLSQKRHFITGISSNVSYIRSSLKWDEFLRLQPGKFRKTVRNIQNRIEKLGDVHLDVYDAAGGAEKLFNDIVSMCNKNVSPKNPGYLSSDPEKKRLFLQLLNTAKEKGWLRAYLLKKNGTVIAIEVDLFYRNKLNAIFSVYDESLGFYSPGSYLQLQILRDCIANGWEYDLGPGGEKYKGLWTKTLRRTVEFTIFNHKPLSVLLYCLCALRNALKNCTGAQGRLMRRSM